MSIFTWLKSVVAGEAPVAMKFADDEKSFGSLDMKSAIDAHIAWKGRLESQIAGNAGETLDVATVAADRNCLLGKWIYGEGRQNFRDMEEYAALRHAHAEFHLCAGSILKHAHEGAKEVATQAIKHDLRRHSDSVQLSLVRLYARAKQ